MYGISVSGCGEPDISATSDILAESAYFEGKEVYSFWDKQGRSCSAIALIDNKPISKRCLDKADCVVLAKDNLVDKEEFLSTLKKNTTVIVNSKKDSKSFDLKTKEKVKIISLIFDEESPLFLSVLASLAVKTDQFSHKAVMKSIDKIYEKTKIKEELKRQFKRIIDDFKQ